MTIHDFDASLADAHDDEDEPWWEQVYLNAFPSLEYFYSVPRSEWAQAGGIDRVVLLSDGRALKIEEKRRKKDYGDIAIEIWSDWENRKPGWACKPLGCDYFAYAIPSARTCYMFPYQLLRRVIREQLADWQRLAQAGQGGFSRLPPVQNKRGHHKWQTINIAVPSTAVVDAIRDCLIVRWET